MSGDVVVHIFLPPQRAFYNLEEFYANATPIELPFENQPPFRGWKGSWFVQSKTYANGYSCWQAYQGAISLPQFGLLDIYIHHKAYDNTEHCWLNYRAQVASMMVNN